MKQKISLAAALFLSLFAAQLAKAQTAPDPLYTKKTATPLDEDRVKLTLESFVSGNNVASDIAIVMDMSISMGYTVTSSGSTKSMERKLTEEMKYTATTQGVTSKAMVPTIKAVTTNNQISAYTSNWTYNNIASRNFPFYLYEGEYYKVQRGNNLGVSGNIRALWIDTPDGRKYLTGSSLSDSDFGSITTDGGNIYSGTLYYGVSWSNIDTGTGAGETTKSYLYKGEYYPVKRNRFNADGSRNDSGTVYALWIDTPDGIKFLYGSGVRNELDASITDYDYYIYYGDLYSGGWTYDAINGPWYCSYGGVLYPVHKSTVGSSYTLWISVNGARLYLNGTGVSDHYVASVNTSNKSSIFFGSLYNGGWKYNDFSTEYSYLYEGNYYIVQRGRFNQDGTPNNSSGNLYASYIEVGGVRKFLSGSGLQDSPYELVTSAATATTCSLFSGTLYSGGWTYSNITGDNAYYYLLDDTYYPVKRSNTKPDGNGNDNVRALWIELPGGQIKYLNGPGLSDDYQRTIVSDSQWIFFGKLYSGGWSYTSLAYGNLNGNAENQWYYRHIDGEYYPVRRANNLDGSVRAMWICLNPSNPSERKYLSGLELADNYDPSITSDNGIIYRGPLYKGWTQGDVGSGYYYKDGDDYYQVSSVNNVQVNGVNTRQLTVSIGGTTYYLNGNTITTSPNPYAANSNNVSLYFGDLYHEYSTHRRVDYLKQAVDALLDALSADAKSDGLHHRVALMEFSYAKWETGGTTVDSPYLNALPLSGTSSHVISDFKDITSDSNLAAMKNAMALPKAYNGGSYYQYGFSLARGLFLREMGPQTGTDIDNNGVIEGFEVPTLTGSDHNNYSKRPKIVVLIGDCEATESDPANNQVSLLKSTSPGDVGATIFVVHTAGSAASQTTATNWASRPSMVTIGEYDETLVATLRNLSKDIRKALIALGSGTVVQDVIADGFEIPSPVSDNIKVYTADYESGKEKEEMTFGSPVLSSTLEPSVVIEDGRQMVRVNGFDFSENYCGTVAGVKHGKKLILEIEIERTNAVGGPSAVTNVAASSGMKYSADGEFITHFTTTKTSTLPVTIQIQKEGLAKGESAVFTVQPVDEDGNPISSVLGVNVKPFRVILTGNDGGTPVTATLKHINGNCYWLVTEDTWSWNYEVNGRNPSLSSKTTLVNPFIFTNVKQGTTIKSAESKVTNDFSTGTSTNQNSRAQ